MKRLLAAALVIAAALAAVAVALGATTLKISANKTKLAYTKKTLVAHAGKVTIKMLNPSPLSHDVAIKRKKSNKKPIAKGRIVGKGGVSKVVVTLKPGKYVFYCTVPGHEAAGMWGTLTVRR